MSSPAYPPQGPPRTPKPYPGPRAGNVLLWIAGVLLVGLMTVIIAGSMFGLFVASHIRVNHQQHGTEQEVNVQSPFGSVSVKQDAASLAGIGLPLYPGATPLPPGHDSAFNDDVNIDGTKVHNAHVHLQIAGQQIDINAAEFMVDAPINKVVAFYRNQLQPFGVVVEQRHAHGETELRVNVGDDNKRIVVIRPGEENTHFMLVHVAVGKGAV